MDGAAFWVMKYSQVSDSLRNDGDQSIPFSGSNFLPLRSLCFELTIISMRRGAGSKALVRVQDQPPPCRRGLAERPWPARAHVGSQVGGPAGSQPGLEGAGCWPFRGLASPHTPSTVRDPQDAQVGGSLA